LSDIWVYMITRYFQYIKIKSEHSYCNIYTLYTYRRAHSLRHHDVNLKTCSILFPQKSRRTSTGKNLASTHTSKYKL
jgi:hypothetical protein